MSNELCAECRVKDKKIQILQADLDFELKKMSEDLAQEKVMLEMQFQKELKRAAEKYSKEKAEREEENKKWMAKHDKIVAEYESSIEQM
jgi:hypothetical protein